MTNPDGTEYGSIWLGSDDDPASSGWYPVNGPVRLQRLAIFQPRITIGDASKDSDSFISSWITGDFTGGVGVLKINEGADDQRVYDAECDTRSPNQTALPPLVRSLSIAGSTCYPLGMAYDSGTGLATYFLAAIGTAVYAFTGGSWISTGVSLSGTPASNSCVAYRGVGTTTELYVPLGSGGYDKLHLSGLTGTKTHGSDITPKGFCAYDGKLMAFNSDGKLYATVDSSTTFTKLLDATGQDKLILDPSHRFRHLISYFDRQGDPALYAITDRSAWVWNDVVSKWQFTTLQFPPHPDAGLGTAVFRSGEDLWITLGLDVYRYSASNVLAPLSGLSRDNGVPYDSRGHIVDLCAEQSCLYALTTPDATSGGVKCRLYAWTGVGWHGLWSANETPTWMGISTSDPAGDGSGYCLHWGTTSRLYTLKLRRNFINPREDFLAGSGWFGETGYVETGRFDANMRGFNKLASHCIAFCDNASSTETIVVKYRTDANPTTYTTLGTITTSGKTVLAFNPDGDDFNEGITFNWMQFRLEFARSSDVTKTPLLEAFILHYTKIPQDTASFEFTIPLPPDGWAGRSSQEMTDALDDLLVAGRFLNFVHQNRSYRVSVASVGGTDGTGQDFGGGRTVNLIEVQVPA